MKMTQHEIAFEMATSSIRYGVGVTREVGMDLADLGVRNALVVMDPVVGKLTTGSVVRNSLDAINFAKQGSPLGQFDGIVAVGGGSTIDTAKAVNLYATYPPKDFLDYVNAPIGKGLPVPGLLMPQMAMTTTAGTGSETTGVSIFDLKRMHAKTGIANRRLKPTLG